MRGCNWILRWRGWQCGAHGVSRVRRDDPGLHSDRGTGSRGSRHLTKARLSRSLHGRADTIPYTRRGNRLGSRAWVAPDTSWIIRKRRVAAVPLLATGLLFVGAAVGAEGMIPSVPQVKIDKALAAAGENRKELVAALEEAPQEQRDAVAFLVAQTAYRSFWPAWDRRVLDATVIPAGLLLASVRLGYGARATFPWAQALGEDTFRRFVLAYRMTTEELADWRSYFWSHPELRPLVDGYGSRFALATTDGERDRIFREMLHAINTGWVGHHVPYAPRGMPDLNPLQAIEQGTGRCTDETNTLIAILRSFGIAATGVRVVYWPELRDNHTWAAVYDPITREWLDIDSGQGGSVDDAGYFHRFVHDKERRAGKIYWVVPGDEGVVSGMLSLRGGESYPPAIEKYLIAKPASDRTERYGDVADLAYEGVPSETLIWLAVWNSGMWQPVAGARSTGEGRVVFHKVGCGIRYRLMTWMAGIPAYCSTVLVPQADGSVQVLAADPQDEASLFQQQAEQWAQSGKRREAKQALIRALEIRPGQPDALYNLACLCSLLEEKDEALDYLEMAVRAGWDNFTQIKADKDLDPIREEERFRKLVEGR